VYGRWGVSWNRLLDKPINETCICMGSGMTLCGGYGYFNFDVLSKS
jgi:hypothetical protein